MTMSYASCYVNLPIRDGDGTTLMERRCGSGSLPTDITSRTNKIELVFVSNNAVTSTGWSVNWTGASGPHQLISVKIRYCFDRSLCCHTHLRSCFISGLPPPAPISSSSTCYTVSGSDPNSECSFPFIFAGQTWNGCTTVDGDPTPWCVTQTDTFGNPITNADGYFSTWGYCQASCPIDQGLTF